MTTVEFFLKYAKPGSLIIYRDRHLEHCYTYESLLPLRHDYDRSANEGSDNFNECEVYRNASPGTMREWCIDNEIPMVDHENEQFSGSVVLPATQAQKFLIKLRWL